LQNFASDKIAHFFVSFLLLVIIFWIRKKLLKDEWFFRVFAYSFRDVLIIWVFKEVIDLFGFGNPEILDLIADFSWVIIPIYLYFLIKKYSKIKDSRKIKFETDLILKFKSSNNVLEKIKFLIFWFVIWFLNIFYLILKIPFLAVQDTFIFIKKILKLVLK
jgi:hypothetical protein